MIDNMDPILVLPDTDTVLVESIAHNGSHSQEIVSGFETAGRNIALGRRF